MIGQVFNILGAMPGGGLPPAVGIPIFFVIFIVGHAFNIGLNVIGTYVHTSRLSIFGVTSSSSTRRADAHGGPEHCDQVCRY